MELAVRGAILKRIEERRSLQELKKEMQDYKMGNSPQITAQEMRERREEDQVRREEAALGLTGDVEKDLLGIEFSLLIDNANLRELVQFPGLGRHSDAFLSHCLGMDASKVDNLELEADLIFDDLFCEHQARLIVEDRILLKFNKVPSNYIDYLNQANLNQDSYGNTTGTYASYNQPTVSTDDKTHWQRFYEESLYAGLDLVVTTT